MTCTRTTARDEMMTVITTAWNNNPTSMNFDLFFQDNDSEPDATPDPSTSSPASWARATITHGVRGQATLANHENKQRYTALGIVVVQVFTPRGNGLSISDELCKIIEDALDGVKTPSGVWFRNVRSTEVGPSGSWFQVNVIAEFEYDEIK